MCLKERDEEETGQRYAQMYCCGLCESVYLFEVSASVLNETTMDFEDYLLPFDTRSDGGKRLRSGGQI